jgi:site-specific DNA-cytosine methylase
MTFVGYTHSGGETYHESDTIGSLTQQSASETSAMTPLIASPLSHGSNPNSNMAGRRREDNENLVAVHMLQDPISDEKVTPAWGKGTKTGSASIAVSNGSGVRLLTPTECERLQSLPDGWTAHGPDSRRYAGLGDAVTASVAEWIGHRLLTPPVGQRRSK